MTIYPRRIPSLEITSEIILLCSSDLNIEPSELSIILFSSLSISEGCLTWKSCWLVACKASLLKTPSVKRSGSSVDREKPRREQQECSLLAPTSLMMCRGGLMLVTYSHRSLPAGKMGIRVKITTMKGNWWQKLTFSWHSPFYSLPILQTLWAPVLHDVLLVSCTELTDHVHGPNLSQTEWKCVIWKLHEGKLADKHRIRKIWLFICL